MRSQYRIAGSLSYRWLIRGGGSVSRVLKRSINIAGHKTSVSVEDEFWDSLKQIAGERGMSVAAMIGAIDGNREQDNLSSALRLLCLASIAISSPAGAAIERGDVQN